MIEKEGFDLDTSDRHYRSIGQLYTLTASCWAGVLSHPHPPRALGGRVLACEGGGTDALFFSICRYSVWQYSSCVTAVLDMHVMYGRATYRRSTGNDGCAGDRLAMMTVQEIDWQ